MSTPGIQMRDAAEDESLPRRAAGNNVRAQVAELLLKKLSQRCERYCLLAGYESLPEGFETDIDFMVSAADFERVSRLVDEIGVETGARLFQVIPHEITACAYFLAAESGHAVNLLQIDSCSDYRHFGKLWLRADEVLEARRQHPRGFWIPAARHEFIYYLIKRVNKRDFSDSHGARLRRLYFEDPSGCGSLLKRFWSEESAALLSEMANAGEWEPLVREMARYRSELRRRSTEGNGAKIISCFQLARHTLERITQPTGGWIAFIGPDGCGKSTVIDAIARELAPAFQKTVKLHLRPKALPARLSDGAPVTDPHGEPVRGSFLSAMKLLYLFADYWIGYFRSVRTASVRTKLVLFDRYFYDILVDPKRVRYGGHQWLLKSLARIVPSPEMVLLLNAPPSVLWARKQEVSFDEVVRQQKQFARIAETIAQAVVIDSAQPASDVVKQARSAIVEYFSRRTHNRLGLSTTVVPSSARNKVIEPPGTRPEPSSIFSGNAAIVAPESLKIRIISKNGEAKWIVPENSQRAFPVLDSWRPYGAASNVKWRVIKTACRMNTISALPGVRSETLPCDLTYWRERIPDLSDRWSIIAYIGSSSPTRKALLFFLGPDANVRAVAKVPIEPAAESAILNEANILERLQQLLPTPRILFRDEKRGIAAQTWIGGAHVAREFSEEHLSLLTSFASQDVHVRLSDFQEEVRKHFALIRPMLEPPLVEDALSWLDQTEQLRSCIMHGDFTPWNLRRLSDGRLTLIDWEWARENGLPWQDVCRYFYLQDYLFRGSANVWGSLIENPLLVQYRHYYGLSIEAARGLTIYFLLSFLSEEQWNQRRIEYTARKVREVMEQVH